jgi:hypothetical protein
MPDSHRRLPLAAGALVLLAFIAAPARLIGGAGRLSGSLP